MLGPGMIVLGTPTAVLLSLLALRAGGGGLAIAAMTLSTLEALGLLLLILMSL